MRKLYDVFHREWWKPATSPSWPGGREPSPGERTYLAHGVTWARARKICEQWNASHDPGPYSRKAEFEEAS